MSTGVSPTIADVGYDDDEPEHVVLISDHGDAVAMLEMPARIATLLVWAFMCGGMGDA